MIFLLQVVGFFVLSLLSYVIFWIVGEAIFNNGDLINKFKWVKVAFIGLFAWNLFLVLTNGSLEFASVVACILSSLAICLGYLGYFLYKIYEIFSEHAIFFLYCEELGFTKDNMTPQIKEKYDTTGVEWIDFQKAVNTLPFRDFHVRIQLYFRDYFLYKFCSDIARGYEYVPTLSGGCCGDSCCKKDE